MASEYWWERDSVTKEIAVRYKNATKNEKKALKILKIHYKRCLETDKLSNEEKQKLIKIKEGLNIIELKKSVETALNDVLQYVRKPN